MRHGIDELRTTTHSKEGFDCKAGQEGTPPVEAFFAFFASHHKQCLLYWR